MHREPNELNNKMSYINQTKFTYDCESYVDWIYFSLKSNKKCKIKIKLQFEGQLLSKTTKVHNKQRLPTAGGQVALSGNTEFDGAAEQLLKKNLEMPE